MTEVKKFVKEVQRMIDEEGLKGISGTNFTKGHSINRVLAAKQYEARLHTGRFSSKARIAQEMNRIL